MKRWLSNALLLLFLGGCIDLGYEHPIERKSSDDVQLAPIVGLWKVESAPLLQGEKAPFESVRVAVAEDGGLTAQVDGGLVRPFFLSSVGDVQLVFLQFPAVWAAARIAVEPASDRLSIYLLDHDKMASDVKASILAGRVSTIDGRFRITTIKAKPGELRAYFEGVGSPALNGLTEPFVVLKRHH